MKVSQTNLDGVLILDPQVFGDNRGYFMETYQQKKYEEVGINVTFVQDNLSLSSRNILRGLHYQFPHGQAKLVQVIQGKVFDVAVDIRYGSPTFGQWIGVELSDDNKRQLFIAAGFAHGFYVLSDSAVFLYKCSNFYSPKNEGGLLYSDPQLNINWPGTTFHLSPKDDTSPCLADIDPSQLPKYNK